MTDNSPQKIPQINEGECPEFLDINTSVSRLRNHLDRGDRITEKFGTVYAVVDAGRYLRYDSVYLMECEGFIKIGLSRDPRARLINIQSSTPFEVSIRALISPILPCDARSLESYLHTVFSDFRVRGEWFSKDILTHIQPANESIT